MRLRMTPGGLIAEDPARGRWARLPGEAEPRHLVRRAAQAAALLVALFAVLLLTPGLDTARHALRHADPGWVVVGVALEALSCCSFTLAFTFHCPDLLPWISARTGGRFVGNS